VVVSLMETQFIDSSVINVLVRADARLRERGRRLVLHVATESVVRRVLEITELSSRLPTSDTQVYSFRFTRPRSRVDA